MTLTPRSEERLVGVHPDLVAVVRLAAQGLVPFIVVDGVRTKAQQAVLVAAGKSRTMHSRHLTGHAVDLAALMPGGISWDKEDMRRLAVEVKLCAVELSIPLEWGGEAFGPSFIDMPHFQLPRSFYPDPVPNLNPDGQEASA